MKVNYRKCDICGDDLGAWDLQCWLRKPIIKWGVPKDGMSRMNICENCFVSMEVLMLNPELIKEWKEKIMDENPCRRDAKDSV